MNSHHVELGYSLIRATPEALDAHSDAMLHALRGDPHLTEPEVGVTVSTGAVEVRVDPGERRRHDRAFGA